MITGVGVDLVSIALMQKVIERNGPSFLEATFTESERLYAEKHPRRFDAYAGIFAAKEAVFKAVAPEQFAKEKRVVDLRSIEIFHRVDGSPYVNPAFWQDDPSLADNPSGERSAHRNSIATLTSYVHLSITDEGDCALAFAVAELKESIGSTS